LGGFGTLGVVACAQAVAVTPGELLADADLIHYTMGASEKDEEDDPQGDGLLHNRKASDRRSWTPKLEVNNKGAKTRRKS